MPRRKKPNYRIQYFSARLTQKLREMHTARTVYIEAPSGYGKTTAVHAFLPQGADAQSRVFWFTALEDEAPGKSWTRFCGRLASIDKKAASALIALGLPDADTIGEIADVLMQLECAQETYLVIDNAHLWQDAMPRGIYRALSSHGGEGLHLVLLAQPVFGEERFLAQSGVLRLDTADFTLEAGDIRAYFQIAGTPIGEEDAAAILKDTEGWIAAVYLTLLHYDGAESAPRETRNIYALMRETVWARMEEEAQKLLLLLAPFWRFTRQQLLFMAHSDEMPPCGRRVLSCKGFVRHDPKDGFYYPHAILHELIGQIFKEQGETYRRDVYARAGQWHERAGDKIAAVECYYRARAFEALFSLNLEDVELQSAGDAFVGLMEDVIENCPDEIKLRHPMTLLTFAYELFSAARHERFLALCDEIEALIPRTAFDEKEKNALFGELALARSFAAYNDIEKMSRQHQTAYRLIGGRSRMVDTSVPWTMGCPSVLYMFHRGAGKLSHELGCMERCLPDYTRLTENHGAGADLLMKAETLLFQGDWEEAELIALRGAYVAQSARQTSLLLCARFLLGRIALMRGDDASFLAAIGQIEQCAQAGPPSLRATAELATAHLLLCAGRPEEIAPWLKQGNLAARGLLAPAVPYAQALHLAYCLEIKDYKRLYSLADVFLARAEYQSVLIPRVYIHALVACARHREGDGENARESLRRALDLALPDGLLFPFAEFCAQLLPVLNTLPGVLREEDARAICRLACLIGRAKEQIQNAARSGQRPYALTQREHEIALLAAQRRSNAEIAQLTCLSLATVRTHLRLAYGKMGIDTASKNKRNLLAEKLKL